MVSGHSCHLIIQGWGGNISNCWTSGSIASLGLSALWLKCERSVASLASHDSLEEKKKLRLQRSFGRQCIPVFVNLWQRQLPSSFVLKDYLHRCKNELTGTKRRMDLPPLAFKNSRLFHVQTYVCWDWKSQDNPWVSIRGNRRSSPGNEPLWF